MAASTSDEDKDAMFQPRPHGAIAVDPLPRNVIAGDCSLVRMGDYVDRRDRCTRCVVIESDGVIRDTFVAEDVNQGIFDPPSSSTASPLSTQI